MGKLAEFKAAFHMKEKGRSGVRGKFLSGKEKLWLKSFHNGILGLKGSTQLTGVWICFGFLDINSKTLKKILKLVFFSLFPDAAAAAAPNIVFLSIQFRIQFGQRIEN